MSTNTDITIDNSKYTNQEIDLDSQQKLFLSGSAEINVDDLVSEISELISLPEVYLKIRELMDDPDSCLDDFSVVVSTDPALIASVLKIVNSAFFGFTGKIDSVARAINLLGIGPLHDLVLSLSAVDALDLSNDIEELVLFWKRSIYCGVVSRLIAKKLNLQNAETLFVVGLLHEIGHLVLFQKYSQQCKQNIVQAKIDKLPLSEVENSVFGTDYAKIGQALMNEWNLPFKFQCVIGLHPDPKQASEFINETNIMHIAHQSAVNKFTEEDDFKFPIDMESLSILKISKDEVEVIELEANDLSYEVENVILNSLN